VAVSAEEVCKEDGGCGRSVFAKGLCGSHYQRKRRADAAKRKVSTDTVREYGAGYNRLSGCVNDERYAKLVKHADLHYGGKLYPLVRDVLSAFADSLRE
jgi:hypothetical protein